MGIICGDTDGPIADIPICDGNEALNQIQKLILQKVFSSGSTKNTIADPTLLASWTPLLAATDNTKVVQTPYINAPDSSAGEARTFGGGNQTRNGITKIKGRNPSSFEGMFYEERQDTIEALKKYQDKTGMGIWIVDENGDIGCLADDVANPTTYYPIPIEALFIGDKAFGNFEDVDSNMISFELAPNWSDKFTVVRPSDFNALTDLATP